MTNNIGVLAIDIEFLEIAMDWKERIVIDASIQASKPVIRGTRLAVEFIIDLLAQGLTEQDKWDAQVSYPR